MLKVDNLTFGYEEEPVLKDISMEIKKSEIVLIEGDNGVGKTTLLKCMTGLINNGRDIYVDGMEVFKDKSVLRKISFVMSDDFLYDYLTVKENIMFFENLFDENETYENSVNEFCNRFGIMKYMNTLVKNLSQGTRNKVYLAIMLSKKHEILVLDEPFTALDAGTQSIILDFVNGYKEKLDKCVVMVTHIDEFKKIATRRYKLKKYMQEDEIGEWKLEA